MKPAILAHAVVLGAVLLGAGTAQAGTLYRWSEPDGALTFSPTPPQDGTPYEEVDPMTMRPRAATGAGELRPLGGGSAPSGTAAVAPASRTPAAGTPAASPRAAETRANPALGAATTDRRAPPRTVVRTAEATHAPIVPAAAADAPNGDERDVVASNDKDERCEELQKRVISLERRLATPLTPLAMDNTVVHMARYQQNYERYCRR